MKTLKTLKNTLYVAAFFAAASLTISSCSENKKHEAEEDTKEVAEDQNEKTFDSRASEKDAQFLVNAAEIGLKEIKLAELALMRSTNADVKELATMMKTDHTATNIDLKELADKKGVSIPTALTEDGEDAFKKLNEKEGKKFDKEYCDMMVSGHKDAIDKFEKASNNATDVDVKNWASTRLPGLRSHLEHSKTCKDKCDKL